jgi:RES domain-containing protein
MRIIAFALTAMLTVSLLETQAFAQIQTERTIRAQVRVTARHIAVTAPRWLSIPRSSPINTYPADTSARVASAGSEDG